VAERRTTLVIAIVLVAAAVFVGAPIAAGFEIDWMHRASALRGVLALAAAAVGLLGLALLAGRALAAPTPPSELLTNPRAMTDRHSRLLPDGMTYEALLDRISDQAAALEFITDRVRLSRAHIEKSDANLALWQDTIRKQEQGRDDLRRALEQSTAALDRIIDAEASRDRGAWAPGAALAILGTVGFVAALLTAVPPPAAEAEPVVVGRFERITTSASRSLWDAAQLEQCEIAEGSIEVVVLDRGDGADDPPTLRVIPNGDECEAVEFVAPEGSGILLILGPQGEGMD
jgi:hypothetical protein